MCRGAGCSWVLGMAAGGGGGVLAGAVLHVKSSQKVRAASSLPLVPMQIVRGTDSPPAIFHRGHPNPGQTQDWLCGLGIRQGGALCPATSGSGLRSCWRNEGFRAGHRGCVDTEVSGHLSAAPSGPQPGSMCHPWEHRARGQGRDPGPQVERGGLQNVALWSFTALASARACNQRSDLHGMAVVSAPEGFRRQGVGRWSRGGGGGGRAGGGTLHRQHAAPAGGLGRQGTGDFNPLLLLLQLAL